MVRFNIPEQNMIGLLYDFDATDDDRGDISSLIYSFVVNTFTILITKFQINLKEMILVV